MKNELIWTTEVHTITDESIKSLQRTLKHMKEGKGKCMKSSEP